MAKAPSSVIGIDLGRSAFKAVHLSRRSGNRFTLNNYAVRTIDQSVETPEGLAEQLRALIKETGGSSKTCSVAITSADAIIRIIEQPETPRELLREAIRLNGMALLNQEVKDFTLDCAELQNGAPAEPSPEGGRPMKKYLVGGLPRVQVSQLDEAFQKSRLPVSTLQLAPICAFNALEFAEQEIFNHEAFMLVDIGHYSSTVLVGVKKEVLLVRAIDFGGQALLETLVSHGGKANPTEALQALEEGDEVTVEVARLALTALIREISSSIGYFEARREENIRHILVSGGPAGSKVLLQILNSELHIACQPWDPFKNCQVSLPADRKNTLPHDVSRLHIACGAAAELLRAN